MPVDAALTLSAPKRIHIIGIGGAGMSGLAQVLHAMGHRVTGSDLTASAVTRRLEALGITVAIGHDAANLGLVDLVTASPAVGPDNPELMANIVDNSGVKFYFTHQLREHDLGILSLGAGDSFLSLQIPPHSEKTIYTSICVPECTEVTKIPFLGSK